MKARRSGRFVLILSAVTFALVLQFGQLMSAASGAPARVAQQRVRAADSRELVAAGNDLKATTRTNRKPALLAVTGGAVAPTVSVAFLLMLDGALMLLFARPREQLT